MANGSAHDRDSNTESAPEVFSVSGGQVLLTRASAALKLAPQSVSVSNSLASAQADGVSGSSHSEVGSSHSEVGSSHSEVGSSHSEVGSSHSEVNSTGDCAGAEPVTVRVPGVRVPVIGSGVSFPVTDRVFSPGGVRPPVVDGEGEPFSTVRPVIGVRSPVARVAGSGTGVSSGIGVSAAGVPVMGSVPIPVEGISSCADVGTSTPADADSVFPGGSVDITVPGAHPFPDIQSLVDRETVVEGVSFPTRGGTSPDAPIAAGIPVVDGGMFPVIRGVSSSAGVPAYPVTPVSVTGVFPGMGTRGRVTHIDCGEFTRIGGLLQLLHEYGSECDHGEDIAENIAALSHFRCGPEAMSDQFKELIHAVVRGGVTMGAHHIAGVYAQNLNRYLADVHQVFHSQDTHGYPDSFPVPDFPLLQVPPASTRLFYDESQFLSDLVDKFPAQIPHHPGEPASPEVGEQLFTAAAPIRFIVPLHQVAHFLQNTVDGTLGSVSRVFQDEGITIAAGPYISDSLDKTRRAVHRINDVIHATISGLDQLSTGLGAGFTAADRVTTQIHNSYANHYAQAVQQGASLEHPAYKVAYELTCAELPSMVSHHFAGVFDSMRPR